MNPQYIAQSQIPPHQYGGPMPPPPQQGGFAAAPPNQMRAPQGASAPFPQQARQNGLSPGLGANSRPSLAMAGDQGMQLPPLSRPPTGHAPAPGHGDRPPMSDAPPTAAHIADQMSGLNMNGQPQPQGFPGTGMPLKSGQPPPSNFISNSSFPPAVNGGSPSDNKSFDSHHQQPPPPQQKQQHPAPPQQHQQQQLSPPQQHQLPPPQQQQQLPPPQQQQLPPQHQQQQQLTPQQQQLPPQHQQQQKLPPQQQQLPPQHQQHQLPPHQQQLPPQQPQYQQQQQFQQQSQQQQQFVTPQYNGMLPPGQARGPPGHTPGPGMPPQLPPTGNLQRPMPPPGGKFQPMGFQSPYNAQSHQGHLQQLAPPAMGGMPPNSAPGMNQGYYQGDHQHAPPQPGFPPPQAGFPPQPGYPSQQPNYPPGYPSPLSQTSQAKRLDPDQMPSPIQVMQEDRKTKSGIFTTNLKGQSPPLVTTDFTVNDQGNASPRFIRSTMYNIPTTVDVMKQTSVPFGLVISPFARLASNELPPPIVNMGEIGPVRCVRCKAYMSPFMQFIDGGRRFHCLLCKGTTEVPSEYFQHLDHTGERVDKFSSPELLLGAYEYVATKEYCRDNTFPKPPALIFMIDVSYNNMKSGMVSLLCSRMKEIIKLLPKDEGMPRSNMRVGFVTYNNTVHFYNLKACLAQPQMMVVGDVNDMFMPLLDGFLVDPIESEMVIDQLMEQIPCMFADTRETETILAPAIQAGLEALKAAECAGKLLIFHSSLPIAEAPGKLKNRDDRKMLGTDKEKTVLAPQNNVYNNLGQDCVGAGCSVDLFIFNNSYIDLATIGQICRLTGGEIFKYTYFQADLDGDRLIEDIKHDVSRPVAFDAVMRVRTSTGIRPTDFYGHFFMSNTTDMELASIDCDKAVALEIKHDDKLTEEEGVFIQVALLYTSCSGQRRVRILNLSLSTCVQMVDLYRACELDTVINFFAKQSVFRLLEHTPKQVKDSLISRSAALLACYRKNCASPSSSGQLILPECMKLLPLYVSCLIKSDAISGGSDMTIDDRSFVMQAVTIMDVPSSVVYFYPRLMSVHDVDPNSDDMPPSIRCSYEKFREDGAYILENGIHLFLWLGLNLSNDWVQGVFAAHSVAQVDTDKSCLPYLDTPISRRMHNLIETIRSQRHRYMRLTIVRQRDKLEIVLKHFLMEDRGTDGSSSYVDFLCHMHKEIRSLLS